MRTALLAGLAVAALLGAGHASAEPTTLLWIEPDRPSWLPATPSIPIPPPATEGVDCRLALTLGPCVSDPGRWPRADVRDLLDLEPTVPLYRGPLPVEPGPHPIGGPVD